MVQITIFLPDEMHAELKAVSAEINEMGFGPDKWAQECIESALATRRLPRMWARGAAHGAFTSGMRRGAAQEPEDAAEAGLTVHRVIVPDMLT